MLSLISKYPIPDIYKVAVAPVLLGFPIMGIVYGVVEMAGLAEKIRALGGRDIRRGEVVDEQVRETNTFSKRLENINFHSVPEKYVDPVTNKIMNSPMFIGCHNLDYQTYLSLKETNEDQRLCPHPSCKKPIIFYSFQPRRNLVLEGKLEEFVHSQEAVAALARSKADAEGERLIAGNDGVDNQQPNSVAIGVGISKNA